ncbi:Prophage antirepressor [Papillibacter cinnamivorans DSM 12816]|uniref:Prophage antirepressor n=1 Tax=Papillibacter cinnamivorans DSM 12816 TaxID=1122930 RepID=A0A1W1YYM0_9FIRM|nr:Prophage antirepressor [Papillibacter cinnamivorans DSM 12816]
MTNLKIIDRRTVLDKPFTIYGDFDNPLFLAKDVAELIKHSNSRMMLQGVDDDEKVCVNNPYASSGQQEQWFLTENGLYEVLMQSRKPIAKQFKREVKAILREIRKTGKFAVKPLSQLEILQQSIDILAQQDARIAELENKVETALAESEEKQWFSRISGMINVSTRFREIGGPVKIGQMYRELEKSENVRLASRQNRIKKWMHNGGATAREISALSNPSRGALHI